MIVPGSMLRTAGVFSLIALLASAKPRDVRDLPDYGVPNYSCDAELMKPSKTVPTSVHSVRPADIKLVMALGDSLTAGNGAAAEAGDTFGFLIEFRGLAWLGGGDKGLENHVTVPNVLRKYNPDLFGYANGRGGTDVWDVVNMQEDWKLLNIFIGGNDMCQVCLSNDSQPVYAASQIQEAVQIIKDNVPRVIVSLTSMLHLEMVRWIDQGQVVCDGLHTIECMCEEDADFTNDVISQMCTQFQQEELKIQQSGVFDATDDFTFVVQPFFNKIVTPPLLANGSVDQSFFAPDCFHFSQKGHAIVGSWQWNNMLEPVGQKTEQGDFNIAPDLKCPDPQCPFIRTTKNSVNCATYWTEAADKPLHS